MAESLRIAPGSRDFQSGVSVQAVPNGEAMNLEDLLGADCEITEESFAYAKAVVAAMEARLQWRALTAPAAHNSSQHPSTEQTQTSDDEQYLTRKELAERLRISTATLDRWRREGFVRAAPGMQSNGKILFSSDEVSRAEARMRNRARSK